MQEKVRRGETREVRGASLRQWGLPLEEQNEGRTKERTFLSNAMPSTPRMMTPSRERTVQHPAGASGNSSSGSANRGRAMGCCRRVDKVTKVVGGLPRPFPTSERMLCESEGVDGK